MKYLGALWRDRPRDLVDTFAWFNLAFLAVDILVAHSANQFKHHEEWIPFFFSLFCAVPLIASVRRVCNPNAEPVSLRMVKVCGVISLIIGITGLGYHLASQFLRQQTIKNLVYTAPLIAPLAYAGIGLLLIFNRTARQPRDWAHALLFLAIGGFFGNFVLALCDHAQNGFFYWEEWISVFSAALAVGFLSATILMTPGGYWPHLIGSVMALQVAVGLVGLGFHLRGDILHRGLTWDALVFGPPLFAPLLYPNLAIVAAFGLFELYRRQEPSL
jgi:hypothetical protein